MSSQRPTDGDDRGGLELGGGKESSDSESEEKAPTAKHDGVKDADDEPVKGRAAMDMDEDLGGESVEGQDETGQNLVGAMVRRETAWLEESHNPRAYVRSRSRESEDAPADEESLMRLEGGYENVSDDETSKTDLNALSEASKGTDSESQNDAATYQVAEAKPSDKGRGCSSGDGSDAKTISVRSSSERGVFSDMDTGLRLETSVPQRFDISGAMAAQSPYAPGISDELSEFGSSRELPTIDLLASSSAKEPRAKEPVSSKRKERPNKRPLRFAMTPTAAPGPLLSRMAAKSAGASSAVPPVSTRSAPEEEDVDAFETIVRGSSKRGLPFGVNTPVPPGATGALGQGHGSRPERKRFEDVVVPVDFPGRRTGNRDDEDIGSDESTDSRSFWTRLISKFRRKALSDELESRSYDANDERDMVGKKPWDSNSSLVNEPWVRMRVKVSVTSWHIGTSDHVPEALLMSLRLILILLSIGSFVVITSIGSDVMSVAYITSAILFAHICLTLFLVIAVASSCVHVRFPTREPSDAFVFRFAAAAFQTAVLLFAVEVIEFSVASTATSLLDSSALSGADAVYSFSSASAIELYYLCVAVLSEFVLNNVPFFFKFSAIPLSLTIVLSVVRVAVAPEKALILMSAGKIFLASFLSASFLTLREVMGKEGQRQVREVVEENVGTIEHSDAVAVFESGKRRSSGESPMSTVADITGTPPVNYV